MNGSDPVESPTITWSLSGQAQAGTSIDASSGLLTVSVDEAADTELTITATYNDGTDHTGSATVTRLQQEHNIIVIDTRVAYAALG